MTAAATASIHECCLMNIVDNVISTAEIIANICIGLLSLNFFDLMSAIAHPIELNT